MPRRLVYLPLAARFGGQTCARHPRAGVGWLAYSVNPQADMDRWCVSSYYHSNHNGTIPLRPGQLPMLWCDTTRDGRIDFYRVARGYAGQGYRGPVLVLNEPDNSIDQCDRPADVAAEIAARFRLILPDNQFVTPNIIIQDNWEWERYLRDFLREYRRLTSRQEVEQLIIGVHFYGDGPRPRDRLNAVCGLLRNQGLDCRLWVTEFGVPDSEEGKSKRYCQWVGDVATHPAVLRYFGYTVRRSDPPLYDWERRDWRLASPQGWAWLDWHRQGSC